MKIAVGVLFLICFLTCGCTKENKSQVVDQWVNESYPTTYLQLPTDVLDAWKKEYLKDKDSCFQSSIGSYGFCASSNYNFNCNQCCLPVPLKKVHDLVMDFFQKNKKFTGIQDTSLVTITSYLAFGKSYQCNTTDSSMWRVIVGNQVCNGLVVENTWIYLWVNYYGVTEAVGYWYPVISIPSKDAISYEMVKTKLLGKHFDFMCWTMIHFDITNDTKWVEPPKRKMIYPVSTKDSIELHVVWVVQTAEFSFYIDVMTGEIMGSFMNFVC
jgi:hypothetical protein